MRIAQRVAMRCWLVVGLASPTGAQFEIERVTWDLRPVRVILEVGVERILEFPDPVQLALPRELHGMVTVHSTKRALYVTAHQSFESRRALVQSHSDGTVYLVDLQAEHDALASSILRVVDARTNRASSQGDDPWTYARMTRYAARQLFAPERLLKPSSDVDRVPIERSPVPLVRGWNASATPLASWKSGTLHVTAVELENRGPIPVELQPATFRGRWLTATVHDLELDAANGPLDRTIAYLISRGPFMQAFNQLETAR